MLETADPTETTTEESEPEETTTISENNSLSGLPNGNYRFVSADFPNRVVTDEELLEAGGAFFLFRKFGDNITGVFGYIDHEGGSCISGTVDGNTVVGTAYGYSENVREGGFLTLGEEAGDLAYEGSVLNLESFSRINAGSRLPVESCP